jgi:hypothetical protein
LRKAACRQWLRGGVAVDGAMAATYALGQAVSVRVAYTDGHGTAEVGRTLSASFELQDLDGMGPVALQWLRGGTAIAGATGASYVLTAADEDKAISVKASFVDLHGGLGASLMDGGAGNDTLQGDAGSWAARVQTRLPAATGATPSPSPCWPMWARRRPRPTSSPTSCAARTSWTSLGWTPTPPPRRARPSRP